MGTCAKRDPIDVAGWTIAFDVSIDKATVEKDSEEDQRVRSAIQQPGDFSLSSLYLKFNGMPMLPRPGLDPGN